MGIGVFGGAFDPVHNGHLFVAEAVRETCGLERVLFVPTRHGHHRGAPLASGDARGDMIRLAIAANTAFAFDDSDLADDATGFTADLLPRLARRYPNEELTFIVGGDSLVHSRWERLDAILDQLSAFVIAPRGEVTQAELDTALAELAPERRARVRYLDLPLVAESATLIRARLAERRSVRYLVPEPVFRYIDENGLYQ
ncbi:MAG TPA: nicotinate (nicotinamide) nucleotide adenylyltransferase [Candidatus Lustribacter sp.]|jgi:nicotinate-nucleotide adenylyltransferase|nr:nicotinate (nicotinamide) nucleotide adenylyltransferase [Candidatus Lustribacter sp.]